MGNMDHRQLLPLQNTVDLILWCHLVVLETKSMDLVMILLIEKEIFLGTIVTLKIHLA